MQPSRILFGLAKDKKAGRSADFQKSAEPWSENLPFSGLCLNGLFIFAEKIIGKHGRHVV
jgi:hypothetical protein